jgi:hypothetical protein
MKVTYKNVKFILDYNGSEYNSLFSFTRKQGNFLTNELLGI